MSHWKKNRGHRTSKIVSHLPFYCSLYYLARARCIAWRVNFIRSKDVQKQLARTSTTQVCSPLKPVTYPAKKRPNAFRKSGRLLPLLQCPTLLQWRTVSWYWRRFCRWRPNTNFTLHIISSNSFTGFHPLFLQTYEVHSIKLLSSKAIVPT